MVAGAVDIILAGMSSGEVFGDVYVTDIPEIRPVGIISAEALPSVLINTTVNLTPIGISSAESVPSVLFTTYFATLSDVRKSIKVGFSNTSSFGIDIQRKSVKIKT